ncbi:MAG: hypothetical protein Q9M91_06665 [Candidatus Dojkabacteria bacterium]|nr:hypothetical protein [Candidatus Dojkabacteria bacterium]MDQ7021478.1 hypothetical protein [Candidatus Dojkabacteria bacterium]
MSFLEILILTFSVSAMSVVALGWFLYVTSKIKAKNSGNASDELRRMELMKLEFDYAKESSINAQQDRLTLVNFYIGLYAGFSTLSFGVSEILSNEKISNILPVAFVGLGLISYVFILQLVRLRQAWIESVRVMNRIKSYFLERDSSLRNYIIWNTESIPKAEKFKTLNYLSAILIAVMGGAAISMGILIANGNGILSVLLGLTFSVLSITSYHLMLKYKV